jgi:formylglycine-generating enzyme required for sulfatase activity
MSAFRLDAFEVTVGRFRAFVEAYPGSRPMEGDGAHPKFASSGWRSEWDKELPDTRDALQQALMTLGSYAPPGDPEKVLTWSNNPNLHEDCPANNVTWYLALAFCAWDKGRLPTEAELTYAIVGGGEQRPHPWGNELPDPTRTVIFYSKDEPITNQFLNSVGSRPAGIGRFGQLDLGGSRCEWALDAVDGTDMLDRSRMVLPCVDCVQEETSIATYRILGDKAVMPPDNSLSEIPTTAARPTYFTPAVGIRCARDLP